MSEEIRIGRTVVPVSDEIYKEYYKMKRRARYLEKDIKFGSSIVDPETGRVIGYKPNKEDSIQRLMDSDGNLKIKEKLVSKEKLVEDVVRHLVPVKWVWLIENVGK